MNAMTFQVLGVAVPYVRVIPARNRRGKVYSYEDRKYAHWKSLVIDAARDAMARAGWKTTLAPVRVDVTAVLIQRPTKKKSKGGVPAHPVRGKAVGDASNYGKGVEDAMQRAGVFRNDIQVVTILATKRWQAPGEDFAGAIVHVSVLE